MRGHKKALLLESESEMSLRPPEIIESLSDLIGQLDAGKIKP